MLLNKVDLNLLVVFDVIYTEGNLTRAAEVLNLTQPAVSNALARLRDTVADPLFVRSGRTMSPTPVAQNLIGPVRQALRQLQTSLEQREQFDPLTADKVFTLATGDIVGSILLPELMDRLQSRAPSIRVQCFGVDRRDTPTEMSAGRLDFAIDIPQLSDAKLNSTKLMEERYVCAMRHSHPNANSPLSMEAFLALRHVTVSSRRKGPSYVDMALGRTGNRIEPALRVQSYLAAFNAVQMNDLVLAAPRSLAEHHDVALHDLPFKIAPLETLLYWHKNVDQDPANIWMRAQIIAAGERVMAKIADSR